MGLGDPLELGDTGSPTRINAKTYHWSDATTLTNMATTPCMRVVPTTTGGAFVKDVAKRRNADNDAWLNDGMAKHFHASDTDLDGGSYAEMLFANMGQMFDIDLTHANIADVKTVVSGAGATATDVLAQTASSRMEFAAGTASGGLSRFLVYGVTPAFGQRMKYQAAFENTLSTNMLFRLGVGAEQVDVANNALRKLGIEGCSAAPEGTVILIFSADNVTRTTQASVNNIVESGGNSYIVQHSPSLNIKLIKGALTNVTSKVDNIPSSGTITGTSGDDFAVIKGGIKSTTTNESKILKIWGQRLVGYISDAKWAQVTWQ